MKTLWFVGCAVAALLVGSSSLLAQTDFDSVEHFEKRIRPLLLSKCADCHSGDTPDGDLNLMSSQSFAKGGVSGELVDGSDTDFSLLYERIIASDEDIMMPPDQRLTPAEIEAVKIWIEHGSVWPDNAAQIEHQPQSRKAHWSFQPIERPNVPVEQADSWCWNPIDAFLLEKMKVVGLQPAQDAPAETWLRRISLDLTGLPPTLAQLQLLRESRVQGELREHEQSVIETLIASRAYAEKQARRWLDLARYADTSGDGTDTPIPEARYYRDWVIDAFDADMPYDQFVIEQLAGDLLAAHNPDSEDAHRQIIATGFVALSRRFGNSKFAEMHQIIDDTIDTVGKSTMGLSLGCARCHHHKFDPVTTEDYYGLYGYFSSTQYPHAGTEHQKERSDLPAIRVPKSQAERYESTVAWAVSDKPECGDARVFVGGDPKQKGDLVPRGFLAFLGGSEVEIADGMSGRLELARRIASKQNPLFARVMANRVWQSHFGVGLVASASNFGVQTSEPLHAELLDYLAMELIDSGWSIKHLHKLIASSHAYRMSSTASPLSVEKDEANQYLARFPRVRMDVETFRDSMLFVSGRLKLGDSGRHPFKPTEKLKYTQGRPFNEIFDHEYRSIYLMTPRLNRHPMLAMFDGADANVTTGERSETTVPLQSLFLVNGSFAAQQAEAFANRILKATKDEKLEQSAEEKFAAQSELMWQLAFSRSVRDEELETVRQHHTDLRRDFLAEGCSEADAYLRAWKSLARIVFASNEFIYID